MDLARQVARMFGVGFHGPVIPKEIDALLDRGVRCVILFKRNVESAQQVQQLCADLKQRAGEPLAMTSHILFSAIDAELPATMSEKILQEILRKKLRFDGVIISDDLEMKAIAANFGPEQTMIRGALAGINLFMICHNHVLQAEAIDLLTRAVERGDVSRRCIEQANAR